MELINCSEPLRVGVQQFDDEHCQLVAITNELHRAIISGTGTRAVLSTLQQLSEFVVRHFKSEEELLACHHYPELQEHQEAHRVILKRFAEIQTEFQENVSAIHFNVMQFLLDWLTSHTKAVDKQYGPFLNSRGIY